MRLEDKSYAVSAICILIGAFTTGGQLAMVGAMSLAATYLLDEAV